MGVGRGKPLFMKCRDFGKPVTVKAPPSSDVIDMSKVSGAVTGGTGAGKY
jgi:hypothetical protein